MKKQIFLLTLLLSVAASAFAVDAKINGLWYELVPNVMKATVIQYKNNVKYSGDIVIPESVVYNGASYSVTSIKGGSSSIDMAFLDCSGLTSVTIPNSVTSIGSYAFEGCSHLTSVHISDIVAWCKIAFSHWESNPLYYAHHLYLGGEEITDLIIPNSVTSIGDNAFTHCSGLTSVTIPKSVTSIGNYAFSNCGLTSVTIPNSVMTIGYQAFFGCSDLTSVTIGNSVTSIGSSAFQFCSSLTSVTIPNSVTTIGGSAFEGCI
jgi:Flp pilus assembly protein protease CpaA